MLFRQSISQPCCPSNVFVKLVYDVLCLHFVSNFSRLPSQGFGDVNPQNQGRRCHYVGQILISILRAGEGSDVEACEADSHVGGCSDKMVKHENRDICGVLVPQWFGLPVQPFSVADFNSMLVPFGTPAVDGKYLCPSKANISQVCLRLRAFSSRGGKALECSSSGRPCRVR